VEGRDGVFVMAASSRPDMIDVALLRPGRIDKSVYLGLPDEEERADILKIYTKGILEEGEECIPHLVEKTKDYTPADLKGLV